MKHGEQLPFEITMSKDMLDEYITKESALIEYEGRGSERIAHQISQDWDTSPTHSRSNEDLSRGEEDFNNKNKGRHDRIR